MNRKIKKVFTRFQFGFSGAFHYYIGLFSSAFVMPNFDHDEQGCHFA
ncbi:hypothetical protein FM109_18015 [Vibrio casei]|nr:hypothetical protein FM109_18015 [Vibrio casei]